MTSLRALLTSLVRRIVDALTIGCSPIPRRPYDP